MPKAMVSAPSCKPTALMAEQKQNTLLGEDSLMSSGMERSKNEKIGIYVSAVLPGILYNHFCFCTNEADG